MFDKNKYYYIIKTGLIKQLCKTKKAASILFVTEVNVNPAEL